jgi:hypothetical protein
MAANVPHGYDESNRAFLQSLMARGCVTFEEARPILAAILTAKAGGGERSVEPDHVNEEVFQSYLDAAAQAVSPFDFEIRNTVHQISRKRVYAVVNTISDPATQLATTHTADELTFIKRVLDAMFETFNSPRMELMCLNEMQAMKLRRPPPGQQQQRRDSRADGGAEEDGDEDQRQQQQQQQQSQGDKGIKASDVEKVLASLVSQGWFERSAEGFYSLTPRALMELRSWLLDSYNDPDAAEDDWQRIKFCVACKEVVTVGQRCADRDCVVRLHDVCQDAFWRSRPDRKCPRCDRAWDGRHFVGERAATTTDAYQRSRRRSGGRGRDVMDEIVRQNRERDEDEDEEEG